LSADPRISAPSALRNRGFILDVLKAYLPAEGAVLEIASGTGEHVAHFAEVLPSVTFQPSDPDPARRASIDAWAAALPNVRPALALDSSGGWPEGPFDAVVCINMVHIAPWAACEGLVRNAALAVRPGGVLLTYGPYRRAGEHTAPSNAVFDADLRARHPDWGIRDLEAVADLAAACGFATPEIVEMPANNLCMVFTRR
jgi:SAM-dependent methyltransferase